MNKKILTALILFLLFAASGILLLLPSSYKLEYSVKLRVPQKALNRTLVHQSLAAQTNSQKVHGTPREAVLLYPGVYDIFVVSTFAGNEPHNSQLKLLGLGMDSTLVHWSGVVKGGNSPWQKLAAWSKSRRLEKAVHAFMEDLRRWEQDEALYGFKVAYTKVRDSVMVARRFTSPAYPSTAEIYNQIEQLQAYITREGAHATNSPMLHVQSTARGYEAQVAIPTDRLLPGSGAISYRRMVMGNILEAAVRGGQSTVEEGLRQLENYVDDHGLISPAIPFALLVTDRTKESDTAKWITRIYYPVY